MGYALLSLALGCTLPSNGNGEGETETESEGSSTGDDDSIPGAEAEDGADDAPAGDSTPGDDGPPSDDDDNVDDGDDGDEPTSNCCSAHDEPSCDDTEVATCVCEMDATCCVLGWDDNCAGTAVDECAATCDGGDDGMDGDGDGGSESGDSGESGGSDGGDGGDGGGATDDCCEAKQGPGCSDQAVQDCVCGYDPFCCQQSWDQQCIWGATQCGATCGGGGGGGGGGTGCCSAHQAPGCDDMTVQNCVCQFDPFCCDTAWDELCVSGAGQSCQAGC